MAIVLLGSTSKTLDAEWERGDALEKPIIGAVKSKSFAARVSMIALGQLQIASTARELVVPRGVQS